MKESTINKVKELERAVGQKQIKIDYLEKMMGIAKTELNIDIKKTSAPHNQLVPRTPKRSSLLNEPAL